jgi:predicted acyltransferase
VAGLHSCGANWEDEQRDWRMRGLMKDVTDAGATESGGDGLTAVARVVHQSRAQSVAQPERRSVAPARLRSLDVLRGFTIVGMLLVNDPGNASTAYDQLRHSVWHGWTFADLVFPFFLFIVGITTHLSLRSRAEHGERDHRLRLRILRRGAIIFGIGLLLNWFPFYQYGAIAGNPSPDFLDHVVGRLLDLRFLGVLQRIGLAYVAAALLSLRAPTKRVVAIIVALLVGYWASMMLLPVPEQSAIGARLLNEPSRTLAAWVDHVTLDWSEWGLGNHIWQNTAVYDPEGLLSTIPAIATTLLGVLAGRWLGSIRSLDERLRGLFIAGVSLTVGGLIWNLVFPINKNLWTSSFVVFTAGIALVLLTAIAWVVDVKRWTGWTQPFAVFGTNPITAYVGAELTAILFDSTIKLRLDGRLRSLHEVVYGRLLAPWMDARVASLSYSLLFVTFWYFLLLPLYRRGKILKI